MPAAADHAAPSANLSQGGGFIDPAPGSRQRWLIFLVGSLCFVLSMFYRVSTAIISPDLARELSLSSAQLGQLSAAFFYAFAANQIPLGLAMDRFGARRVMAVLAVLAVAGAVLFAAGHSFESLLFARVLLGIGMSGNLMVVLALMAAWFPVDRFAFMGGMVISIGTLGNMLAATPPGSLGPVIGLARHFFCLCSGQRGAGRGLPHRGSRPPPGSPNATCQKRGQPVQGPGPVAHHVSLLGHRI
jgi:MFS family permease